MKYVILRTTLKLYLVYKQILDGKTGSESGSVLAKITQLHTGAKKTHHLIADHIFSVCLMTNLPPHLLSDAGFFHHLDSETCLAGSSDEEHHCLPVHTHTHSTVSLSTHTHAHTPLPPCPPPHTQSLLFTGSPPLSFNSLFILFTDFPTSPSVYQLLPSAYC